MDSKSPYYLRFGERGPKTVGKLIETWLKNQEVVTKDLITYTLDKIRLGMKVDDFFDPDGELAITQDRIIYLAYRKDLNEPQALVNIPFSHVKGVFISRNPMGIKKVVTVVKKDKFVDEHPPHGEPNLHLVHRKKGDAYKTYGEIILGLKRAGKT